MPGAHGPFVEPGWPNLQGPDISASLATGLHLGLTAAQMQAETNLKQRALENQLAQHIIANKEHRADRELRQKMFDARMGQIDKENDFKKFSLGLAAKKLQRLNDRDMSQEQAKDALAEIPQQMADEGWVKGQDGYAAELSRRSAKFIGKLPNSVYNKWMGMQDQDHKGAASLQLQNFKVQAKQFDDDLSRIAFHGSLQTDLQPILHAEDLPDEPTPSAGWNWSVLPFGVTVPTSRKKGEPTGNKMVPFYDSQGNRREAPVPFKDLLNLKTRYQDLKKLQGSISTSPQPSASVPTPAPSPITQNYGVSPQMQADVQRAKDALAKIRNMVTGDELAQRRNAVIQRLQQQYPGKDFSDL